MKRRKLRLRRGSGAVRAATLAVIGLTSGVCDFFACTQAHPPAKAPAPHTAESYVRPYTADFGYGSNMGYYGEQWPDTAIAAAIRQAGGHTMRVTLPEQFLDTWGWDTRLPAFRYYSRQLGMRELVCFVGEPSAAHRDPTVYPGCREPSKLFANLYEPIWKTDSTVNEQNYYACYIYNVLQKYGQHIRFWEVVNEPDFITGTSNKEWLTRAPRPAETTNTLAPITAYIRMLRITWEVVKHYAPDDYVTPGGLGYAEYLDALLRYTDNPHQGAVSPAFPAKGGAYFDVVDYHVYPSYYLRKRNLLHTGFNYQRNSDNAAAQLTIHKQQFEAVLRKHGYDGRSYPAKHFIVTETNISRRTAEWRYSSDAMQRNFGMKALVAAQRAGIRQVHFYSVAEAADAPPEPAGISAEQEFKLMGLYQNMSQGRAGQEKLTPLGVAFNTTAQLLQGFRYDAARSRALQLPEHIDGAAFSRNGDYRYVLWAKTRQDQSEQASATYTFPAAWGLGHLQQKNWDYATTGSARPVTGQVELSGTPTFFEAAEADRLATAKQ